MPYLRNLLLASSMLFVAATGLSAQGAMVSCTDGSTSAGGRGACSGHGGIAAKASVKADTKVAKAEVKADAKIAKADAKAAATKADAKTEAAAKKADAKSSAMKADARADAKVAKADAKAAATKADAKASVKSERMAAKSAKEDDNAIAAGATATCKDGTYSHARTHQGSCSRHGGVAKFMDAK